MAGSGNCRCRAHASGVNLQPSRHIVPQPTSPFLLAKLMIFQANRTSLEEGVERWPDEWLEEGTERMAVPHVRTLSEGTILGLTFLHKYRFLTIAQFAKCASFSSYHAGEVLRGLERWGYIGYFGYVG